MPGANRNSGDAYKMPGLMITMRNCVLVLDHLGHRPELYVRHMLDGIIRTCHNTLGLGQLRRRRRKSIEKQLNRPQYEEFRDAEDALLSGLRNGNSARRPWKGRQ